MYRNYTVVLIYSPSPLTHIASSISFKVSSTMLNKSGEWVEVSWANVDSPDEYDWVGVFSPPREDVYQINLEHQAPIKLQVIFAWGHCVCITLGTI